MAWQLLAATQAMPITNTISNSIRNANWSMIRQLGKCCQCTEAPLTIPKCACLVIPYWYSNTLGHTFLAQFHATRGKKFYQVERLCVVARRQTGEPKTQDKTVQR